jgi:hypothetical protein
MASNSPEYPNMSEWKLRLVVSEGSTKSHVYGPPHPIDGGNYAPLISTNDHEFAAEVVRRWNGKVSSGERQS